MAKRIWCLTTWEENSGEDIQTPDGGEIIVRYLSDSQVEAEVGGNPPEKMSVYDLVELLNDIGAEICYDL